MKRVFTMMILSFCFLAATLAHDNGFIGYKSVNISKEKAQAKGIENHYGEYITRVVSGTAAETIGLRPYDMLIGINGKEVNKEIDFSDLLDETKPGDQVKISLIRDGQKIELSATLGERVHNEYTKKGSFLGVSPSHASKPEGVQGTVLGGIVNQSNAQMMGLEQGDIVSGINEFSIYDWHDLEVAMDNIDEGENITVNFIRDGEALVSATMVSRTHNNTVNPPAAWNAPEMEEMDEEDMAEMPEAIFEMLDIEPIRINNAPVSTAETSEEDTVIESPTEAPASFIRDLQVDRLTIFPNPNSGTFEVSFFLPESGDTEIRIFDQSGREVYNRSLGNFDGLFQDRIDISNQAAGNYFLFIRQNDQMLNRKISVVKP